jgi:hypothetical protein
LNKTVESLNQKSRLTPIIMDKLKLILQEIVKDKDPIKAKITLLIVNAAFQHALSIEIIRKAIK